MPSINALPDELLAEIVATVVESSGAYGLLDLTVPCTLALVNRRFHRLALPHLYGNLRVTCDSYDRWSNHVDSVHRSLVRNPDLGRLCRQLTLVMGIEPTYSERQVEMAAEIAACCTAVTSLKIGSMSLSDDGAWPRLRQALPAMARLERLVVQGADSSVSRLMDMVGSLESLRSLTLWAPTYRRDEEPLEVMEIKPAMTSCCSFFPSRHVLTSS